MYSQLKNKLALITGASSGIGRATALEFAKHGCHLILIARSEDKLKKLKSIILKEYPILDIALITLDVQDRDKVFTIIDVLKNQSSDILSIDFPEFTNYIQNWTEIDVLLNNAGLALGVEPIQTGLVDNWETMIDTNIKGLLYISRVIIPFMLERNYGHIVNIGSIAGREAYPGGNVYCATKHAVKALNATMKHDLNGTDIRVSSIDPGLVNTNFSTVRFDGDSSRADNIYKGMEPLVAEDIAEIISFTVSRKQHVNIAELFVIPTAQASAQHIARQSL